jgi:NAD(P)H-quinone oxidoreductase subunit N
MALLTTGKSFIQDMEKSGALGLYVPPEGGFEGRYQRRLRSTGYVSISLSARGLGDLAAYLMGVHGVRPPHLGKKDFGEGSVGPVYYLPPIVESQLANLPPKSKGLLLWIIDGKVLSRQEIEYLSVLPSIEKRVKVAVELGSDRAFRWIPLKDTLVPA